MTIKIKQIPAIILTTCYLILVYKSASFLGVTTDEISPKTRLYLLGYQVCFNYNLCHKLEY